MSKLTWYWHRLRAMNPDEMFRHVRKKSFQWADRLRRRDWAEHALECSGVFPMLSDGGQAPEALRTALRRDTEEILSGRWRAFGHVEVKVDDPPRWQCDYAAGVEIGTQASAFRLNHRSLPAGADIKWVWELSRWNQLTRLAMAMHVTGDAKAGRKCVHWLEDWVRRNPPFTGWNWTSALESGMRLLQFTWMDALLRSRCQNDKAQAAAGSDQGQPARASIFQGVESGLDTLRYEILPPHVWFTWRYRSFGSSANNHLIGELAGLILATVRWPALARWGAPLEELQRLWEREVLAQFAEDGGNREQALNYHWFSWEFCWQARAALRAARRTISPAVEERLASAADYFAAVQVAREPWDYGDSDSAFVLPCFADEAKAVQEWLAWLDEPKRSPAIHYWLGEPPRPAATPGCIQGAGEWLVYPHSGQGVCWTGEWHLRWDVSPLGYLSTAAHGHLDALHLSLWLRDVALVIDPGTGAYYGDARLREHLASWAAHNGPHPSGSGYPRRIGAFLWAEHHGSPDLKADSDRSMVATLLLPHGRVKRIVRRLEAENGWQVDDDFEAPEGAKETAFEVCWQFAPGSRLEQLDKRIFQVTRERVTMKIGLDSAWRDVEAYHPEAGAAEGGDLRGVCSPSFRRVAFGPRLRLTAPGHNPCLFRTTFLASASA